MNDRQRLEAIIAVVCKYLPPDGISRELAMNEIIKLVDPLPEQTEPFDRASFWHKQYERAAEHATFMGEQVKIVMEWNEKLKTKKSFEWVGLTDKERNEMIGKIQHDQFTRQRDLIGSTQIITEMYLKERNT
jgi:hypothetical protein